MHSQIADGHKRRGHADSAEGVGARSVVKVLIPLVLETPWVGVRVGALHEDR